MDTISQENNESFSWLPWLAVLIGVIAGVLAGVALGKVSNLDKTIAEQSALASRIDDLEAQLRTTTTTAEQAGTRITKVTADTNKAFQDFGQAFGALRTEFDAIKEQASKPAPVVAAPASGGSNGPAVAGPGEYLVKSGDNGYKIARTLGVSWTDLQTVNPSVNWNKLAIGQPIKVPKK